MTCGCHAAGQDLYLAAASKFQSLGAIAQLGERYNGIVEVDGSIPSGSTNQKEGLARRANPFFFLANPKRMRATQIRGSQTRTLPALLL